MERHSTKPTRHKAASSQGAPGAWPSSGAAAGALALAVAALIGSSCQQCSRETTTPKPEDDTGGLLVPPLEKQPLELTPLPQPPAVTVTPGSIAGIPAGPVTVVVARPQGELRGTQLPAITFNKPVVAIGDQAKKPPVKIEPAVEGSWRWIGSTSVEFVPTKDFKWATEYKVSVDAGLTSIDGTKLEQPYAFTFTTLRPQVRSSEPGDGWRWLPQSDAKISLHTNMPLAPDYAKHISIVDGAGANVPYKVSKVVDVEAEAAAKAKRKLAARSPWGKSMKYELALQKKLAAGTKLKLSVDDKLAAEEGPLAAEARSFEYEVAGPLKFTSVRACHSWREDCPYGPVILYSTNEPDVETLRGKITFDPPAKIDEDELSTGVSLEDGGTTIVSAAFRAGTKYTVKVAAGVKDALGQSAPAFSGEFTLTDVDPDIRVPSSLVLLESAAGDVSIGAGGAQVSYPVESVNVETVRADITPLSISDMARAVRRPDDFAAPSGKAVTKTLDMSRERNVAVRKPLPMADVFPAGAPKLFHLEMHVSCCKSPKEMLGGSDERIVVGQITDLAVHAKLGPVSGIVWVTSLSKGAPVADATVKLWDAGGKEIASAVTDADGIAKLPGIADLMRSERPEEDSWWSAPEVLVSATTKDGDTGVTLSTWDGEIGPHASSISTDWEGDSARTLGVLVTERGIYRPGDEVFIKGIVRIRKRGVVSVPKADSEMQLSVDARGKNIAKTRVPLSKYGTFSTKVKLPDDGGLGWHEASASATIGSDNVELYTSFRVEEYKAPTFKVDVKVPKPQQLAGEALQARVEARYLFGGAMPGAPAEVSVLREATWYAPPGIGNDKYDYGVNVWGYDDDSPSSFSETFARQTVAIGNDGGAQLDLGELEAVAGRPTRYTIEADVADVSRRRVANRADVLVHPASVYVGLKAGSGFGEVGKPMPIEMIAVDVDGKRKSGAPIELNITRREWKSIKKKDPDSGRFIEISEPEEVKVTSCKKSSAAGAASVCELTADKAGYYILTAVVSDEKGRKSTTKIGTYVTGGGWVSWQRGEGETLELVPDKKEYEPGETAKILVKSPWPEAEALVTVEREGVRSVRRQKLSGSAGAVDILLEDGDVPNTFVSVIMVRGRVKDAPVVDKKEIDPGRPQVRAGYVRLGVAKTKKKIDVAVDVGAGPVRPGQKLKVKVAVKDFEGKGVPAEVTLWAVDEAVLRLTGYSVPSIVDAIHPSRGLSVRFGESLIFLVRKQDYGEKGRPPGGDGGGDSGSGFRSNFKTTAFFVPDVITDAQGKAEIEVKLPDDLTTYRVMALAITEGDRVGGAKTEFTVTKPLLVLPALPRLARTGDVFEAGVVVHSQAGGDVKVKAELPQASAALISIDGSMTKTVAVQAGKAKEVRFPMKADTPGRAVLRFSVESGAEKDGIELKLPIVLPTVMETFAAAGDTVDKREEGLAPPKDARVDVGGLEVALASTALAGYQDALEQLVDYPYGCAEQLASRLVPFIAVRELESGFGITHKGGDPEAQKRMAKWLGINLEAKDTLPPDDVVKATVKALEGLQEGDGGFRYWPTSGCSAADPSTYATLALFRAKELGYPVSAGVVERAQKFLSERVVADKMPSCYSWWSNKTSPTERVFALWVLARTGKPKNSALESHFNVKAQLPLFARAMLADAYVVGKDASAKQRSDALIQEVMNAAKETAREVHFEDDRPHMWSSDVRTTSIMLMTLVDAQPEHPFVGKIAQYLKTAKKNGRYRSTQEAAFALMAVSELVRAREREAPDFVAKISLGDKVVVEEDFRGRNLDVFTTLLPMAQLPAASNKPTNLVFAKTGDGTLSYTATLRFARKEMPTDAKDHGIAVQRWLEPYAVPSGGGQARKVRAGELVRIKVRVASPTERSFVAVDVPLPAGLEIVDASLASAAAPGDDGGGGDGDEGEYDGEEGEGDDGYSSYVWTPFNHHEYRDDRAVFFADRLPPGVYTASVNARATTLGKFVLKPATAEEMYAPEVGGRSDGGFFEVLPE